MGSRRTGIRHKQFYRFLIAYEKNGIVLQAVYCCRRNELEGLVKDTVGAEEYKILFKERVSVRE